MARDQFVIVGGKSRTVEDASFKVDSSAGLFFLSMIIFSLSIMVMVIFACGDNGTRPSRTPRGGHGHGGVYGGGGGGYGGCHTGGGCGSGGGGGCGGGGGGGSTNC